jgi:hypothetical protein
MAAPPRRVLAAARTMRPEEIVRTPAAPSLAFAGRKNAQAREGISSWIF